MGSVEVQVYKGVPYRRYPEASHHQDRDYFRSSSKHGKRYLHRVMYEDNFGPPPAGWHVHHRDGVKEHNVPSNLVAVSPSDHLYAHLTEPALKAQRAPRSYDAALASALSNLMTEEVQSLTCEVCGEEFHTFRKKTPRFCSGRCRTAAWRARQHA